MFVRKDNSILSSDGTNVAAVHIKIPNDLEKCKLHVSQKELESLGAGSYSNSKASSSDSGSKRFDLNELHIDSIKELLKLIDGVRLSVSVFCLILMRQLIKKENNNEYFLQNKIVMNSAFHVIKRVNEKGIPWYFDFSKN